MFVVMEKKKECLEELGELEKLGRLYQRHNNNKQPLNPFVLCGICVGCCLRFDL